MTVEVTEAERLAAREKRIRAAAWRWFVRAEDAIRAGSTGDKG